MNTLIKVLVRCGAILFLVASCGTGHINPATVAQCHIVEYQMQELELLVFFENLNYPTATSLCKNAGAEIAVIDTYERNQRAIE
jgi:hypothetical protein